MKRLLAIVFAMPLVLAAGAPRVFTIGGAPFAQGEILDARAQPDLDGRAAILITFSPAGATRLAVLSRDHIGKAMRIELDGQLLAEPVVRDEIKDGVAQISGSFSVPEADALALAIAGKPPLSASLDGP